MSKVEDIEESHPLNDGMRGKTKRLDIGLWGTAGDPNARIILNLTNVDGEEFGAALSLAEAKAIVTSLAQTIAYAETGDKTLLRIKH